MSLAPFRVPVVSDLLISSIDSVSHFDGIVWPLSSLLSLAVRLGDNKPIKSCIWCPYMMMDSCWLVLFVQGLGICTALKCVPSLFLSLSLLCLCCLSSSVSPLWAEGSSQTRLCEIDWIKIILKKIKKMTGSRSILPTDITCKPTFDGGKIGSKRVCISCMVQA